MTLSSSQVKEAITTFIAERLAKKLEKETAAAKRAILEEEHEPATWIADAALRAPQIQVATHILKAIHPDAKGTNLNVPPDKLPPRDVIGSSLATNDRDAVGNAAALDVNAFLSIPIGDKSLLQLLEEEDGATINTLRKSFGLSKEDIARLAAVALPKAELRSHGRAKQIYWLVGAEPTDPKAFRLLLPLYPSSLVQRAYQTIQSDKFGDEAKTARASRKAGTFIDTPIRDYPNLAVQRLGGTKPQNISQLNSKRGGNNYLLASFPPVWRVTPQHALRGPHLFAGFRGPSLRDELAWLQEFLLSSPPPTRETRRSVAESIETICDLFIQHTGTLRDHAQLASMPGWPSHQLRWLGLSVPFADDLTEAIGADFARWLLGRLRRVPLGEVEATYIQKLTRPILREAAPEAI